jgi:hypothetical protein
MAYIYEVNGQRVEFEKEPTDADIDEAARALGAAPTKEGPVAPQGPEALAGAVAPAVTGAAYAAETGLPQLAKTVGESVGKPLMQAAGSYLKNPINVLTDVALTQMGAPPVAAAKKMYDTYQGAKQVVSGISEALGQQPENVKKAFDTLGNKLGVEGQAAFTQAYEKNAAALGDKMKAVQQTIKEFQLPDYANSKSAQAALSELQQGFKPISTLDKIGKVAGPLARGAGRVLGPAGMAMNVYDAANFAQEADLGGRLARGEGKLAQQTFNNMVNKNTSGYQPSAQEARNLLDSGDERTINIYGGRKKLQQIANPNAINSGFAQQLNALGK